MSLLERIAAARRAQQEHAQRHNVQLEINMEMDEVTKQQIRDAGRGHLLRDAEVWPDVHDPEEVRRDEAPEAPAVEAEENAGKGVQRQEDSGRE